MMRGVRRLGSEPRCAPLAGALWPLLNLMLSNFPGFAIGSASQRNVPTRKAWSFWLASPVRRECWGSGTRYSSVSERFEFGACSCWAFPCRRGSPYRPVQRGQIDLKASIKTLFEGQALEGILHLLSDDRALSGSGQSELVRGACWIAPISNITAEGAEA